jgi:Uma2 family endonuclease
VHDVARLLRRFEREGRHAAHVPRLPASDYDLVMSSAASVTVRYAVQEGGADWELSEATMPESVLHDAAVRELWSSLDVWAARVGRALVVRNLAIRWRQSNPRIGVDPDVAVLSPPPPEGGELRSVRTWLAGHTAPCIAVEVVSETNPRKDYVMAPDKYAASGTRELWIFNPLLVGPRSHGGPFRLQVWTREADGSLARAYAGEGPGYSGELGAWLVVTAGGQRLRIADDAKGARLWPTREEAERRNAEIERAEKERERAARERERAAKERERAEKERALERVKELEAQLAAKPTSGSSSA